ncbi:OmpA/MotB family protein [Halomonas mongoliensis]|uniref:OmpA/MotB family protein n=1 Tax=Halomonas mongoliensis TaxID=321265 RepID=UPI00403AEA3E
MRDRNVREVLTPSSAGEGDGEAWLVSYLDVLTLLITLFVLLLAMAGNGLSVSGSQHGGESTRQVSSVAQSSAIAAAGGLGPMATGIQPRHDGLKPRFQGLEIEGVSVDEGAQGITLRIDDNLLFASGQADLISGADRLLSRLVVLIEEFDGDVSVEGHTDSIPIATVRFPSNWELSTARAISVLRYLANAGVEEARLRAIGYADTRPLESNATAEGRAANRRVELLLHQQPR